MHNIPEKSSINSCKAIVFERLFLISWASRPTKTQTFRNWKKKKFCLWCQVNEFIKTLKSTRKVSIHIYRMRFVEQDFK